MRLETLTSRQRVVNLLNGESVDRLPIDLGCHPSSGISAFAYWDLREYLGLPTDGIWVPDAVQFLAYVDEDIMERFHLDVICLEPRWPSTRIWNPRGKYRFAIPEAMNPVKADDGSWIVSQGSSQMRMPSGGYFFDGSWISNWGGGDPEAELDAYARRAEYIYKETPYATNFTGYSRGWGFSAFFGGIERLITMMLEPEKIMIENENILQYYIKRASKIIDRMGEWIQLISIGDDMGMQNGPACRPSVVEQCVMPYIKRFCEFIHANSDIKVFMHNCGSIRPFIPMLIDAGVDVLNPVQISAANMDPKELAEEFGGKIIFWGGCCNTQSVLPIASPEGVRENVKELVRIFRQTNSCVINQVHNIMGDVKPENIVTMLDTAYEESFIV